MKSTTRIPDISTILQEKKAVPGTEVKEEEFGEDAFTEKQLISVWQSFAQQRKKDGKDAEFTVLDQPIRLEGTTVILTMTNAVKQNILDRFRPELLGHLKKELNNRHLVLETELIKEEQSHRPYTAKEKFDFLIAKKPVLKELRDRLGLDPDF